MFYVFSVRPELPILLPFLALVNQAYHKYGLRHIILAKTFESYLYRVSESCQRLCKGMHLD